MSKLDLSPKKIQMPIVTMESLVICSRSINKHEKELITIVGITEKEEAALDKGYLKTVKDNKDLIIDSNNIICYGAIDFNTDSDDFYQIEDMNWLEHLSCKGISIPADYDYETHTCYPPERRLRYTETFNPAVLTQYMHGLLGKPKRCLIYKKKIYVK